MSLIHRPISPPPRKRRKTGGSSGVRSTTTTTPLHSQIDDIHIIRSPIRLYTIKNLDASENVDTITLQEILYPQSTLDELWSINFMTDMPFLRQTIGREDETRIKIRIIHGYWREDDPSRKLMEAGVWGNNVKLIAAYLPLAFGTHHSKIIVLFRADSTAQVVIHTANMIPFDHENMTNAVFITGPLPLKREDTPVSDFEAALIDYLSFYSPSRTAELVLRLQRHDFTSVAAHFISSVPGKFEGKNSTKWGLGRLQKILQDVEGHQNTQVFAQFSSVGSLGKMDTWLTPQFYKALSTSKSFQSQPQLRLVYPTLKNVQESLNGYRSGSSIHWTITSPAHEHQERYMRPLLRQWHGVQSGRERAAPHIKTYGRVTPEQTLDWFLLTSANLSKPAWGTLEGKLPNIGLRIRSYEAGVLLDPALYGEGTVFVPTYKSDFPSEEQVNWAREKGYKTIVGIRMAWDLPFKKYDDGDVPWIKNRSYEELYWLGMSW